jgi:Right handed beta helix region
MKRVLALALVIVAWALVSTTGAFAATHWVDDNAAMPVPPGTSCERPGYQTIQSAVAAAAAGDTINVCPGTYPEQVVVETAAKSNLLIRSVVPLAARIQAPPTMEPVHGDLVRIDSGARNVTLRGFVVSGPLPDTLFCAVQLRSGVRVKGGASANITGNVITEIRSANPALRGCQNGFAIAIGRRAEGQVGQATILANRIDRYQKGGIYVDNAGSRATIRGNLVQGDGPNNVIAQNGMQISRGAVALVRDNLIREHAYFPPVLPCIPGASCVTATGILLFEVNGSVEIDRNELRRNQDGVGIYTASANRVSDNRIIGGIATSEVPGNTLGDGIFADVDTAGNRIVGNFLRDNVEHDCHDESVGPNNPPAFVANVWIDNDGRTENKPGLCRGARDDDDDDDDDEDDDDRGRGDRD